MVLFRRAFITTMTGLAQSRVSTIINTNMDLVSRMKAENRLKLSFAEVRQVTNMVYARKVIPVKKVQVFYNLKSGVGSTTFCHQTSALIALMGFKVLVIDCDPQANITNLLRVNEVHNRKTLFDIIECAMDIERAIYHIYSGYDVIPADLKMLQLERLLSHKTAKENILSNLISSLKPQYDFIFIDASPSINILNTNVLFASDIINIVCEMTDSGFMASTLLVKEIERLAHESNRYCQYTLIANKYDSASEVSKEVLSSLKQIYQEKVLNTVVRLCDDFNKSKTDKEPVFFSKSIKSPAVQDIVLLAQEITVSNTIVPVRVPARSFKKAVSNI